MLDNLQTLLQSALQSAPQGKVIVNPTRWQHSEIGYDRQGWRRLPFDPWRHVARIVPNPLQRHRHARTGTADVTGEIGRHPPQCDLALRGKSLQCQQDASGIHYAYDGTTENPDYANASGTQLISKQSYLAVAHGSQIDEHTTGDYQSQSNQQSNNKSPPEGLAIPSFFEIKESDGARSFPKRISDVIFFEARADCKLERGKRTRESPILIK
jgi:hypothetical protein